ncbi:MAG: type III secretion system export apparatus subunit SctT [Pseudomonadota bacterium]
MNESLGQLEDLVLAFLLSVPRLVVIMTLIPFLGRTSLPGLVRNGVVISLAMILLPAMVTDLPEETMTVLRIIGIIVKEVLVGLVMGFAFSIIFHTVEAVGFYIDNQRGSAMAGSIDPLLGGQTSPIGLLLTQAFVTFFLVSGGFLAMMSVIYASYQIIPVISFVPVLPEQGADFVLAQVDRLSYLTFVLAMPVFAAMFIAEIGVALISRFAPQMNVFVLAMPIKSAMAFLALVLYVRILFDYLSDFAFNFASLFQQIRQVL